MPQAKQHELLRAFQPIAVLSGLLLSVAGAAPASAYASVPAPGASGRMTLERFSQRPKLVLVVVVDQFRADYLTRFRSRFLPAIRGSELGGYNYLVSRGAYYPFARYNVLQNMTGPGHSMILNGSYPYQSGIPVNNWHDTRSGKPAYCVQDDETALVGSMGPGMSPRNLVGTTLGDELKNAGQPSKVVGISLKDRSAILLAGHRADEVIWFDAKGFRWVSSRFYQPKGRLPGWVQSLNESIRKRKGGTYAWASAGKPTGLTLGLRGFKHQVTIGASEALNLPFGLEITTDAALKALGSLELGQDKAPDILAVSYSSHDYLGHTYGPNTLELEEMTLAGDREIARLLNGVRRSVPGGMKDVVVVLTADHGIPPSPAWLKSQRVDAGWIPAADWVEQLEGRLNSRFGKPDGDKRWVSQFQELNLFLNPEAMASRGAGRDSVEEEVKAALESAPGVAQVVTRSGFLTGRLPSGALGTQVRNSYFLGRSGDVVVIPKPFYMDGDSVTHVTGYSYDRTVPLVLAGDRFIPGVYAAPADIVDIAPTLAFLLGVIPPATSEGRVLAEALGEPPASHRRAVAGRKSFPGG